MEMKVSCLLIMMESFHEVLVMVFFALRKALIDRTIVYGLSYGQPKILEYLSQNDGCMQKDFCRAFSLEPSTVSSLLQKMEKNGLLARRRSPDSARTVNVHITDRGREVQLELMTLYEKLEDVAMEGFSPKERTNLYTALFRIRENLMRFLDD